MSATELPARTGARTYHPVVEAERRQAGWYRNPDDAGMRYWDGTRWTEDVRRGYPLRPGIRLLPQSRIVRGCFAAVGVWLLVSAVRAWIAGNEEGWADGSFALVWYSSSVCFAGGAVLCLWLALGRRKPR